jgi:hypothetical protein
LEKTFKVQKTATDEVFIMKYIILIGLLVSLFVLGCSDLPPEPADPGSATGALTGQAHAFQGFAQPENYFTLNAYKFIFANLDDSGSLSLDVSADDYVWGTGYLSNEFSTDWRAFTFDGTAIGESGWMQGAASKTLNINLDDFEMGENYVAAYACSRVGTNWDCHNGEWMLWQFFVARDCPVGFSCEALDAFGQGQCMRSTPCDPAAPGEVALECQMNAGICRDIPDASCDDGDNGKTYNQRGATKQCWAPGDYSQTEIGGEPVNLAINGCGVVLDTCVDDNTLKEFYCLDDQALAESHTCDTGSLCVSGACATCGKQRCKFGESILVVDGQCPVGSIEDGLVSGPGCQ